MIKYRIHVGKLSWPELWQLTGRSAYTLLFLIPSKLFGAARFDQVVDIRLEIVPLTARQIPHQFQADAEESIREMSSLGFRFLFADVPTTTGKGCALYFQRDKVIGQHALQESKPVFAFLTFKIDGEILVTTNLKTGLRNGGVTHILEARDETLHGLLDLHQSRYSKTTGINPSSHEALIALLENTGKRTFDFNVARGVYEILDD